jgi:hypothetical protein
MLATYLAYKTTLNLPYRKHGCPLGIPIKSGILILDGNSYKLLKYTTMTKEGNAQQKKGSLLASKAVLLIIVCIAVVIATICFIVLAFLPRPEGSFLDAPLRGFLTGLGLFCIACPPYIVGFALKKRAEASPYFELGFIRTGFNIFALVCFGVGLTCIGLSAYALIERFLSAS